MRLAAAELAEGARVVAELVAVAVALCPEGSWAVMARPVVATAAAGAGVAVVAAAAS